MIDERKFLTRTEAESQDKAFYAEYEDEYIGCWAVFGDNSGFMYCQCASEEEAESVAKEMNRASNGQ
jgi:hypothetical protein